MCILFNFKQHLVFLSTLYIQISDISGISTNTTFRYSNLTCNKDIKSTKITCLVKIVFKDFSTTLNCLPCNCKCDDLSDQGRFQVLLTV